MNRHLSIEHVQMANQHMETTIRYHFTSIRIAIVKNKGRPWLVWLSGLSTSLRNKGSSVWFPTRAHAWVAGQVPNGGVHKKQPHIDVSLSFSLPSFSLKINKILKNKKKKKNSNKCWLVHSWWNIKWCSHFSKPLATPQMFELRVAIWPSNSTAGYVPPKLKMYAHTKAWTLIFIVVLFLMLKIGNNPKAHQLANGWTRWGISTQWNIIPPQKSVRSQYMLQHGWALETFQVKERSQTHKHPVFCDPIYKKCLD